MECREHVRTWHACQNACVSCILIAACTCSPFKITCKACLAAHTPAKHAMRVKMPCVSYSCETCHACQNATYSGEGTCQAFAQMLITEGKHVLCCDWRCERVQIPCNQRKDCVLGLQDASLCKPHTHPPPPPPTRTHAHTHTVRVATRALLRIFVQAVYAHTSGVSARHDALPTNSSHQTSPAPPLAEIRTPYAHEQVKGLAMHTSMVRIGPY